jgi:hypothetical protein
MLAPAVQGGIAGSRHNSRGPRRILAGVVSPKPMPVPTLQPGPALITGRADQTSPSPFERHPLGPA